MANALKGDGTSHRVQHLRVVVLSLGNHHRPAVANDHRHPGYLGHGLAQRHLVARQDGGWTSRYSDASYGSPGLAQYAGPGHWNDPDMLEVGNGGMTDTEYRSHFSLWAMMAAPLIAGNDLRSMTQATREILTNAEVIAVDQDPLGIQGRPISSSTTLEVWSKRLSGNQSYAVILFNRTAAAASITVTWSSLGITSSSATVRDLWSHMDLGPSRPSTPLPCLRMA